MTWQVEFRSPTSGKSFVIHLGSNEETFFGEEGEPQSKSLEVNHRQARILASDSMLYIEPVQGGSLSVNGNSLANRIGLNDGDWVTLGNHIFHVRVSSGAPDFAEDSGATVPCSSLRLNSTHLVRIGRQSSCDIVIGSPLVSRQHAEIEFRDGRYFLHDLGSTNGTFLNAKRVTTPTPLQSGDCVEIATFSYVFTGGALEPVDSAGRVRIEAHGLSKVVLDRSSKTPRHLLEHIDLVVEPGEFLAIFGTSGSGKSTLLDALNGRRPASTGRVLYNGIDLYSAFDLFRSSIGYVPQQDIVHRKITVRSALRYTAQLRLPPDTTEEEIDDYIARVLEQVGLEDKAWNPIDTPSPLSGGQLKRVSLAVELIANPNVLFLDEVTSGLDAGTDKKMMQLFAELAAGQKTVICVTHTLENIDVCHLVLLLHHGRIIYLGPPQGAKQHFGVARLSDVYERIESRPVEYWVELFNRSPFHATYISERMSKSVPGDQTQQLWVLQSEDRKDFWRQGAQLLTLMRRYVELLVVDRRNLAILLLQAPVVAVLVGLVFEVSGPAAQRAAAESQIAFILVVTSIWCGCINSTREIVKELPIYIRERSVNLGILPYALSKLLPLSILGLFQCFCLLGIVTHFASWSGDFLSRLGVLFATMMAATTMGLSVSTLVDSNDKAIAVVPILLIPQVILSDFMVQLGRLGKTVAQGIVIAYSGFDAMKATLAPELSVLVQPKERFWVNIGIEAGLCFLFLLASLLGLKLKDKRP